MAINQDIEMAQDQWHGFCSAQHQGRTEDPAPWKFNRRSIFFVLQDCESLIADSRCPVGQIGNLPCVRQRLFTSKTLPERALGGLADCIRKRAMPGHILGQKTYVATPITVAVRKACFTPF